MKLLRSIGGPNNVSLPEITLSCLHSLSNILHGINIHYLSSVHLTSLKVNIFAFSSCVQVKQSKHIAPLWQLPLQDVCRMMNRLGESWQEAWASEEQQEDAEGQADYDQRVSGSLAQMLDEMHDLQNLCRVLQPRELQDDQEYLELDQNSDSPLKRKSPYILKRQLRTNKSRRPYILKRSVYY
uniref:Neurotensin/neuromedin N n=1 Tax=Sinocyclocheilus anshuiensis TaxID=1608454 RepID=A0A671RJC0_9TELE